MLGHAKFFINSIETNFHQINKKSPAWIDFKTAQDGGSNNTE